MRELKKWDDCTKVLSVRITQAEYEALREEVQKANRNRPYRNKETASSIAREMIRHCLINEIKL